MIKTKSSIEQTVRLDRSNREAKVMTTAGDRVLHFDGQVDRFVSDSDSVFPVKNFRELRRFLSNPNIQAAMDKAVASGRKVTEYSPLGQLAVTALPDDAFSIKLGHQDILLTPTDATVVSKNLVVADGAISSQIHSLHAKVTEIGYRTIAEEYSFYSKSPVWD